MTGVSPEVVPSIWETLTAASHYYYQALVRAAPPRVRRVIKRPVNLILLVLTVVWAAFVYSEWLNLGDDYLDWDWMLISSGPAVIPTIYLSAGMRAEFYRVFRQLLRTSGTPDFTILRTQTRRDFEGYAARLERHGACIIATAEFLTITYVFLGDLVGVVGFRALTWSNIGPMLPLLALCTGGGWIAGKRFGRLLANASLLHFLDAYGWKIRLIPGHPDRVGGMRRFGTFLIYQFRFAAVPMIWLAAWAIVAPHWRHPQELFDRLKDIYGWHLSLPHWFTEHCIAEISPGHWLCSQMGYSRYSAAFAALWLIAFTYMAISIAVPLYRVHLRMRSAKRALVDEIGPELLRRQANNRHVLGSAGTPERALEALSRYATTAKSIDDLRKLPVWPLDMRTVTIFAVSKFVTYVLPLAAYMAASGKANDSGFGWMLAQPLHLVSYVAKFL
jgi:hypothetical protein